MSRRFLFVLAFALVLGIAGFPSVPHVAAQTPINTSPQSARYLENQWHYIPPHTTLWFLFDYSGDRSIVELFLVDGTPKKLEFNVWTPGQASGREDSTRPIGHSSAPTVNCESGKCPSNHILWKGALIEGGTYFVEVINNNPVGIPYLLWIVGGSVTLRVPPPESLIQLVPLTLAPTVTAPTPSPVLFALGHPPQIVTEYAQRWLGFAYPGERAQVEITIPGGADARLMMFLFWQDTRVPNSQVQIIGEASAKASDLTWVGELSAPGAYYIQVLNNNPLAQTFQVIVMGTPPGTSP